MTADLALDRIEKRYGSVQALAPLTLDVPAGTFLSVLGPSGSGKTTVLRLIGGFTEPSGGRVRIGGEDVTDLPIFRRPCNTVFQDYALFPHMSVAENVGYGPSVRGRARAETAARVAEVLAVVGLETMARRRPHELSGGQRQRVALARALLCEPRLLLLDEPLAALDANLRRQMQEFLRAQQRRAGITFLFVTHDQSEAIGVSDLILVMRDGRAEQVAAPADLYWRPATRFVAGFFGDMNLLPARVLSRTAGEAMVDTPVGRLRAADPNRVGEHAFLALRPEAIGAGAGEEGVEGVVEEAAFAGAGTDLWIRAGQGRLRVRVASARDAAAPERGSVFRASWRVADAVLVEDRP